MTRTAVVTIVSGRHVHLARQLLAFSRSTVRPDVHVVVSMGDPDISAQLTTCGIQVLDVDVHDGTLPLARARNLGADVATRLGCDLLIFLDVDCLPDRELVSRYVAASKIVAAPALLCGPVTYLPPPTPGGYDVDGLSAHRNPHSARPVPADDEIRFDDRVELFWSLSFAVHTSVWRSLGGFDTSYTGYGGEDTDFGFRARAQNIPIAWVGGAHAYHQHHPVSDPPVEHVRDILANAAIFHAKWQQWPMLGWLRKFEERGLVAHDPDRDEWTLISETDTSAKSPQSSATSER